jgi:hypothetical protein
MKTLLLTALLTLAPVSVLACGESFIVTTEGQCVNLTAEMQSPLRSVFSNGKRTVPTTPIPVQVEDVPVPTVPRAVPKKPKPVDPFGKKEPNNIVPTPEWVKPL